MSVSITFYENLVAAMQHKDQELLKVKKQLESNERRFKALIEHGSDITSITNEQGIYIFVSENAKHLLGRKPSEIIGRNALDFLHPEDKERVHTDMLKLYHTKRVFIKPFRYMNSKGNYIWLCTTATNLLDDSAVKGIVTNSRDVTAQQVSLGKINEQNLKLKNIAWTQSHQVRTYIARILSLVEILKGETLTDEQQVLCEYIAGSTNDLDKAVREIISSAEF